MKHPCLRRSSRFGTSNFCSALFPAPQLRLGPSCSSRPFSSTRDRLLREAGWHLGVESPAAAYAAGVTSFFVASAWDRSPLAELPFDDGTHVEAVLATAHARFQTRERWWPKRERLAALRRAGALFAERSASLLAQAIDEGGKPLTDSRVELARAQGGFAIAERELAMLAGREVPMDLDDASALHVATTHFEPRGVVLAVSAFNHPVNLLVHQVLPALAAGCPVLLKPSLATPLSARAFVALLHDAGVPPDYCQLLLVDNATTERLVADPRVAFLSFVGAASVGWMLRGLLAPGAHCALEHGGAAPAIVRADADLDLAVPRLVKAAFYHAGQVCISAQRLFVEAPIYDAFVERFVAAVRALRVGDPRLAETDVGPLIRPRELDRVDSMVKDALAAGARLLTGGAPAGRTCYAPTVLESPSADSDVALDEAFGPLAFVQSIGDIEEGVRFANATRFAFQASVFTRDLDAALFASRRLNATAVLVNEHPAFRVDWMPFGGHQHSGLGVGGFGPALRELSLERLTIIRSASLEG